MCAFFMQNFCLTLLTFRLTFTPLTFCVSRDLKFFQSQYQAAELNWRQFDTKSQMKSAPFSSLILNSGIIPPPTEAGVQLIRASTSRSKAIPPTFSRLCFFFGVNYMIQFGLKSYGTVRSC